MTEGLYRDPLNTQQREEFEEDLISFCDRELDELGDIGGQNVLYAGGTSLLWLEGLAERIGPAGGLTALDADTGRVERSREFLMDLPLPVRIVAGSVFDPPFEARSFDLVYSAGLFHELDVRQSPIEAAIDALAATLRAGGRLATSDFVDSVDAAQLEDEAVERDFAQANTGARLYGIQPPELLIKAHKERLLDVVWRTLAPRSIRHLDRVVLNVGEPDVLAALAPETQQSLRERRAALLERVRREGYTRPATLYVEGRM